MLTMARLHGFEFSERGSTLRGVARAVPSDKIPHQIGTFQHNAALCRLRRRLSEIAKECGLLEYFEDTLFIANGFARELNDRTWLNVPIWTDVVTHSGRHRAERFTLVIPISIHDRDRQTGTHLHHEAPHLHDLFRR